MPSICVECDHLLVGDEVEYLYKGKSYCDDSYRAVKKLEATQQEKEITDDLYSSTQLPKWDEI